MFVVEVVVSICVNAAPKGCKGNTTFHTIPLENWTEEFLKHGLLTLWRLNKGVHFTTMKTLAIILLTTLSTFAQFKEKKLTHVNLCVHTFLSDGTTLSCDMKEGLFRLDKTQIFFTSSSIEIELKVLKKRVGVNKSWFGVSRGVYYLVTAVQSDNGSRGVMLQPVEKDLTFRTDVPTIVLANKSVCE